jgi:hypothetical protein
MSSANIGVLVEKLKITHNLLETLKFFHKYPQLDYVVVKHSNNYNDEGGFYDSVSLYDFEILEGQEQFLLEAFNFNVCNPDHICAFDIEDTTGYPNTLWFTYDGDEVTYHNPGPDKAAAYIDHTETTIKGINALFELNDMCKGKYE